MGGLTDLLPQLRLPHRGTPAGTALTRFYCSLCSQERYRYSGQTSVAVKGRLYDCEFNANPISLQERGMETVLGDARAALPDRTFLAAMKLTQVSKRSLGAPCGQAGIFHLCLPGSQICDWRWLQAVLRKPAKQGHKQERQKIQKKICFQFSIHIGLYYSKTNCILQ